jgi:hypothetical protein
MTGAEMLIRLSAPLMASIALVLGSASGCMEAKAAQPSNDDRSAARTAALAAYEARKAGAEPFATIDERAECPEELVAWRHREGIELCSARCTSDVECASGERCRVLHHAGMETARAAEPLYADDVPEIFAEADAESALIADGLLLDEAPVCEGECSGAEGLPIQPSMPVALCDPL